MGRWLSLDAYSDGSCYRGLHQIYFLRVILMTSETKAFIRGYAHAIAKLSECKGGQKVAALDYAWADFNKAGVDYPTIEKIKIWLSKP